MITVSVLVDILESFPLYGLLLEVIGSCVSPAYRVMSTWHNFPRHFTVLTNDTYVQYEKFFLPKYVVLYITAGLHAERKKG